MGQSWFWFAHFEIESVKLGRQLESEGRNAPLFSSLFLFPFYFSFFIKHCFIISAHRMDSRTLSFKKWSSRVNKFWTGRIIPILAFLRTNRILSTCRPSRRTYNFHTFRLWQVWTPVPIGTLDSTVSG